MLEPRRWIRPEPLTASAWAPFGQLIAPTGLPRRVNQGTAARYDWLSDLVNLRPQSRLNLAWFHCDARALPVTLDVLERHRFSTQVFIPLGGTPFLLVVRKEEKLRAFIAQGTGISYAPGVWHAPIAAVDTALDLVMLVHEDGSSDDTELRELPEPITIRAR